MGYGKDKRKNTTWISVPIDETLHGDVRVAAVKAQVTWPAVVAEALRLWLAGRAT